MLMELVQQKGRAWKEIGPILNRLPEGCRDKHKEISLGANKNKGRWTDEEVTKLRNAVHEYLAKRVVCTCYDECLRNRLSCQKTCRRSPAWHPAACFSEPTPQLCFAVAGLQCNTGSSSAPSR